MSEIVESFIPNTPKKRKLKVGLFFGTFNPVHAGHLILAQTALNEGNLDYVWMVVSPQNPFKVKKNLLSEYDRYRMVELALEGDDRIQASNVEFKLPRPSYTVDTLTYLADTYRNYEFSLIMGQDNLQHFHKWKNHDAILKYYKIFVYPREGAGPTELDKHRNISFFKAKLLDISATYIRKTVQAGKSVRYFVPPKAYEYIEQQGLFRD